MYLQSFFYIVSLVSIAQFALAAPIPQLAGEGAACNSIFTSTDNGVGYGIEDAEDNTAGLIRNPTGGVAGPPPGGPPPPGKRQLAGEGAACDAIFSSTDNGVGYGIEDGEDNTAKLISSLPKAPVKLRRQLDKIANGAGAIGDAAGVGAVTGPIVGAADGLDGTTTSGAAMLGQTIGDTEVGVLEGVGSAVP